MTAVASGNRVPQTADGILAALAAAGDPDRAAKMAAYHKAARRYLGVAVPGIAAIVTAARRQMPEAERPAVAQAMWQTDIHEARVAAARLLQMRRPKADDAPAWRAFVTWVPDFDAWAIADHACKAGEAMIVARPERVSEIDGWTTAPSIWVRRAAVVVTLPFARMAAPDPMQAEIRDRVLGWLADYAGQPDWFMQKSVSWWLRTLGQHDPDRVRSFLAAHGDRMKPFARKDAARRLPG